MAAQFRLGSVIPNSAGGGTMMPCGAARARESGADRLYGTTLLHEEGAEMPAAEGPSAAAAPACR